MYDMIDKFINPARNMCIIEGDFNAELGQGIGGEKLSVGQSTLKEANKRRMAETMAEFEGTLGTQHHVQKKTKAKQATCRTPDGCEKQLDHILVNRRYRWFSKDVEANDMTQMGGDHRRVLAHFVIPAQNKNVLPSSNERIRQEKSRDGQRQNKRLMTQSMKKVPGLRRKDNSSGRRTYKERRGV